MKTNDEFGVLNGKMFWIWEGKYKGTVWGCHI